MDDINSVNKSKKEKNTFVIFTNFYIYSSLLLFQQSPSSCSSFCEYLFSNAQTIHRYSSYLGLSHVPDEKFFTSILLNSPFRHSWLR